MNSSMMSVGSDDGMTWKKAARCQGTCESNCVEVAEVPEGIAIRDSENPGHGFILMGAEEWEELKQVIRTTSKLDVPEDRRRSPSVDKPALTSVGVGTAWTPVGGVLDVAILDDGVAVRDRRSPEDAPLLFSDDEWDGFVDGVRAGDFDMLLPEFTVRAELAL